ncbi:hypothetical protein HJFPF1_01987 [Paramyrothecium foliicola]|nr:hypothetical protein HJFPF1_01987 [Paramyrothecium foliicola]
MESRDTIPGASGASIPISQVERDTRRGAVDEWAAQSRMTSRKGKVVEIMLVSSVCVRASAGDPLLLITIGP